MSKIGFIGLGIMGTPMAGHLIAAGHELFLHSIPSIPDELTSAGGTACASAAEVASNADTIIIMVPDTPHVEAVLFGENGVAEALSAGKTVVDMSSISPLATKEFAAKVAEFGCDYVDAPVSGGTVGAEEGNLSIMAGGSDAAFARAQPLFDVMGRNINHLGSVGAGQVCKSANQAIVGMTLAAVAEGLTLATKAGVDPGAVRKALLGGFAESRVLDLHGGRMVERAFEPGGRASVQLKDINQALELAGQVDADLPSLTAIQKLWQKMIDKGWADLDQAGIIRAIEEP